MLLPQNTIKCILVLAILLSALPVILIEAFALTDAGSHLYNAKLLLQLFNESKFLDAYIAPNNWSTPNWTSHLFLSVLLWAGFSGLAAQKILILFYVIGFPWFAMLFLKEYTNRWSLTFILVLVACYSYIFSLGFYNFLLGLVFLMAGGYVHLKLQNTVIWKKTVFLFCFFGLLYFTHIFVFGIGVVFIACLTLSTNFSLATFLKAQVSILIAGLPFLLLGILFLTRPTHLNTEPFFMEMKWLFKNFYSASPLQGTSNGQFKWFGYFVSLFTLSILLLGWVKGLANKKYLPLLLLAVLLAIFYFILPDSGAGGSYINERLNNLFWIFLLLYASCIAFKPKLQLLIATMVFGAVAIKAINIYSLQKPLSDTVVALTKLGETLNENSVVYALTPKLPEQLLHADSYVGVSSGCLLADNYEAYMGYFPIIWRFDLPTYVLLNHYKYQLKEYNQLNTNPNLIGIKEYVLTQDATTKHFCLHLITDTYLEIPLSFSKSCPN